MRIRQKIKTKPEKNKEFKREDISNDYLEKLLIDSKIIQDLLDRWERIKDDPKLETFMFEMNGKFFSKETNNPHSLHDQKLVIFTEAIDTVEILKNKLKNTNHKVLDITASNRDKMRETIKANFDANYSGVQRNDYDVLITTEVLAEGVNLHRCNVIVNYDTPWNSTRLMQRIGRVNRIGSKEDFVHVYNFFPSSQGDAQLELVKKALTKLQAFHTVFGEDSQVFSHEEEVVMHGMTKFEVDESETPTTKFIDYLKRFKAEKPEDYAHIFDLPEGLCAAKTAVNAGILFHIKANEKDTGLYYKTDIEGIPTQISPIQMAELLQCSEKEPSALPLPENWEIVRDRVYITFNEYLINSGLTTSSDISKSSIKARGILGDIIRKENLLPQEIKEKLVTAKGLISQGNDTLARQIIKLDTLLQKSLFDADKIVFITDFVERHLKNIKQTAKEKNVIKPYTALSVTLKS
jgi:hypothetical protein